MQTRAHSRRHNNTNNSSSMPRHSRRRKPQPRHPPAALAPLPGYLTIATPPLYPGPMPQQPIGEGRKPPGTWEPSPWGYLPGVPSPETRWWYCRRTPRNPRGCGFRAQSMSTCGRAKRFILWTSSNCGSYYNRTTRQLAGSPSCRMQRARFRWGKRSPWMPR